jgi:hypothetical protein
LINWLILLCLLLNELIFVIGPCFSGAEAKNNIIFIITFLYELTRSLRIFRIFLFELGLIGIICHCWLIASNSKMTFSIAVGLDMCECFLIVLLLILRDFSFVFWMIWELPVKPKGKCAFLSSLTCYFLLARDAICKFYLYCSQKMDFIYSYKYSQRPKLCP